VTFRECAKEDRHYRACTVRAAVSIYVYRIGYAHIWIYGSVDTERETHGNSHCRTLPRYSYNGKYTYTKGIAPPHKSNRGLNPLICVCHFGITDVYMVAV
jgi:hypothetical protein